MAIYSTPKIRLLPVFILFFGLEIKARIALAFIHALFPIAIAIMTGIKDLNPRYIKLAQALRASPLHTIVNISVRLVAPAITVASRMGFGRAIIVKQTINKETKLHPLVHWQYRGELHDSAWAAGALRRWSRRGTGPCGTSITGPARDWPRAG